MKKKFYLVLDCETTTMTEFKGSQLGLARPLIYDVAWKVVDRKGTVYSEHSYLVQEIFFNTYLFENAYYAWKRPLYFDKLQKGEIIPRLWNRIMQDLITDMKKVAESGGYVTAYNAEFDYNRALNFTDGYIQALYTPYFDNFAKQAKYFKASKNRENFEFRNELYPVADIWGIACTTLINNKRYKKMCVDNGLIGESGRFFKTSAETTYRYLTKELEFEEEHTALADVNIEVEILVKALKRGKVAQGIPFHPYRMLGTVQDL